MLKKFVLLVVLVLSAQRCKSEFVSDPEIIPPDEDLKHEDEEPFVPSTQTPIVYRPAPRIVGGMRAAENQFPFQVSLRYHGRHICGGSIISSNYVLTAGHCVVENVNETTFVSEPSSLSVRAGSIFLNSGGVVVNIALVKLHYDYMGFINDIALLQLATTLTFNDNIRAIALNTEGIPVDAPVVTSGWGRLGDNLGTSSQLMYVTLRAMSIDQCRKRIGNIPLSILCLGKQAGGYGVCSGDSGGPAVFENRLVGVTNFVVGGCGTDLPDGYAKVSTYVPWIRRHTDVIV